MNNLNSNISTKAMVGILLVVASIGGLSYIFTYLKEDKDLNQKISKI